MNKNIIFALLAVVVLGFVGVFSMATSQPPPAARRPIFSTLKVGQTVAVKERNGLYEVSTMDEAGPLTHKVAEIGEDYLAVRDEAGATESRIPVTAVRAVIHVKTKPK